MDLRRRLALLEEKMEPRLRRQAYDPSLRPPRRPRNLSDAPSF